MWHESRGGRVNRAQGENVDKVSPRFWTYIYPRDCLPVSPTDGFKFPFGQVISSTENEHKNSIRRKGDIFWYLQKSKHRPKFLVVPASSRDRYGKNLII